MEAGGRLSHEIARFMQIMEELAPKSLAEEWDNVGLQVGNADLMAKKVLVTLTVTESLVARAIAEQVDLVISHHPLIFKPIKHLRTDLPLGKLLQQLLEHRIAVYVSHTNLDHAAKGLNHWLAQDLELQSVKVLRPLDKEATVGLGRIGRISPQSLERLAKRVASLWDTNVKVIGDSATMCTKVAVCGGTGGDLVRQAAFKGADVLITGDVDYHDALEAKQLGLAVLDAGHFGTEQIMVKKIAFYLQQHLPQAEILLGYEGNNPFCVG